MGRLFLMAIYKFNSMAAKVVRIGSNSSDFGFADKIIFPNPHRSFSHERTRFPLSVLNVLVKSWRIDNERSSALFMACSFAFASASARADGRMSRRSIVFTRVNRYCAIAFCAIA